MEHILITLSYKLGYSLVQIKNTILIKFIVLATLVKCYKNNECVIDNHSKVSPCYFAKMRVL